MGKKILFTWELGEGSGHTAPYVRFIKHLEAQGHTVYFAVKQLQRGYETFKGTKVKLIQSPIVKADPEQYIKYINSYSKILHNVGYYNNAVLTSILGAWITIYETVEPDLVIFDYSPSAMLAAKSFTFNKMQIGNGFFQPSNIYPLPSLDKLQRAVTDEKWLKPFEDSIVMTINSALAFHGIKPIRRIGDIHRCNNNVILGIPELFYYPHRKDEDFYGFLCADFGTSPDFLDLPGPKVFCYIYYFPQFDFILDFLSKSNINTLLLGIGIPAYVRDKYIGTSVKFTNSRYKLSLIAEQTDLLICNGNFGTMGELIMRGVPMLTLPIQAEQNILAKALEDLGVGINAGGRDGDRIIEAINDLLNNPSYKKACKKLGKKYPDSLGDEPFNKIIKLIESLL